MTSSAPNLKWFRVSPRGRKLQHATEVLGETWDQFVGDEPTLLIHGDPGEAVEARVISKVAGGWTLCLTFEPRGEATELVELACRPGPGSEQATAPMLRQLGLTGVFTAAEAELRDPVNVWAWLGSGWPGPVKRPGRRGRREVEHAIWAKRYVEALTHDPKRPNQWIIDRMGQEGRFMTVGEVQGHVNRAKPNFLTRSPRRGVPGGELTTRAKEVLEMAGEVDLWRA